MRLTKRCGTLPHSATIAFFRWLTVVIVNIDKPSVGRHPEQHNWLDLSLGCLGATCQARSTLITLASGVAGLSASSDISRGSVVTHFGRGGIYSNSFVAMCLLIPTVKEFWKSVNIWWSYEAYNKWCHFWPTLYINSNRLLRKKLSHILGLFYCTHASVLTAQDYTTRYSRCSCFADMRLQSLNKQCRYFVRCWNRIESQNIVIVRQHFFEWKCKTS